MSKKLDIPGSDLWVLSLFTDGYGREYYIREISALLPISHGTAQTILERLEKKLVISSFHLTSVEKPGSSGSNRAR